MPEGISDEVKYVKYMQMVHINNKPRNNGHNFHKKVYKTEKVQSHKAKKKCNLRHFI